MADGDEDILDISAERFAMAREDAGLTDKSRLVRMLGALSELSNRVRFSSQKRVLLEVEIIRLSASGSMGSERSIPARISENADAARPGNVGAARTAAGGSYTKEAVAANRQEEENTSLEETAAKAEAAEIPNEATDKAAGGTEEERYTAEAEKGEAGAGKGERGIDILKSHWTELVNKLIPSNRPLFAGAMLKEERGNIVVIFKNSVSFKMASQNVNENGILKLRELAYELIGEQSKKINARLANPGEISTSEDKVTDEELSRINFHIDIEG